MSNNSACNLTLQAPTTTQIQPIPTGVTGVSYCPVCDGQGVLFCNHETGRFEAYVNQIIKDDLDWMDCYRCQGNGKLYDLDNTGEAIHSIPLTVMD